MDPEGAVLRVEGDEMPHKPVRFVDEVILRQGGYGLTVEKFGGGRGS